MRPTHEVEGASRLVFRGVVRPRPFVDLLIQIIAQSAVGRDLPYGRHGRGQTVEKVDGARVHLPGAGKGGPVEVFRAGTHGRGREPLRQQHRMIRCPLVEFQPGRIPSRQRVVAVLEKLQVIVAADQGDPFALRYFCGSCPDRDFKVLERERVFAAMQGESPRYGAAVPVQVLIDEAR